MIFLPLLVALAAGTTLIEDFFPNLTFIDVAVFFILGWISGIGTMLAVQDRRRGRRPPP